MDVVAAYQRVGTYRGAAAICGVDPKTVKRKVSHRGGVRQWTLNPVWVRLHRDEHEEFGIERLFLVSHGRKLPIGGFLGAKEKESFALALSGALGEARRGPTRTVI